MNSPINAQKALIERESYGFANTRDILDVFSQHGWREVSQQVVKVRKPEREGYQKHLIRLENDAMPAIQGLSRDNATKPQLVIVNSHDGTSSLQMLWGLFRLVCANGLVAGTAINGVRLVHSRSIVDKLPEAIRYMLDNFPVFQQQVEMLQGRVLSEAAQAELVRVLYNARLANIRNIQNIDYSLRVRRPEDNAPDAYTVFNRVQEVLVRGGIRYTYERPTEQGGQLVATTTRGLSSVNSQVKLNQLAFDTVLNLAA